MNKPFRFFIAACAASLGLVSCQSQTKSPAAASAQEAAAQPTPAEAAAPERTSSAAETSAVPADVQAFLAANNLAPLWQADFGRQGGGYDRPLILDGFYGAEHRHIAVLLERVTPAAGQPGQFRVQGRTRYKKNITPFDGTITVTGLKALKTELDLDPADAAQARAYTATARFVLREDPRTAGAGTYQGTALMDFYRLFSGKLDLVQVMPDDALPTGGGGLLFRGQWQSQRTGQRQDVSFATYAQAVLPDAMADLYIGERDETLNPKYAHLDWSEAWENTEWWAESSKNAFRNRDSSSSRGHD